MSPQRSATCSPFFAREVRSPSKCISNTTSSNHFITSPSSSFGSLRHCSLLDFIAPPGQPDKEQSVQNQFGSCPQFLDSYHRYPIPKDEEARILASVRHLCPHACYLRAFAPVREFQYLRKAVLEYSESSGDDMLRGWSCTLLPKGQAETSRPSAKVCFCSPDGKEVLNSKVAVLRKLGIVGRDFAIKSRVGVDLDVSETQKQKIRPENVKEVTVKANKRRRYRPTIELLQDLNSPFGLLEELFHDHPWKLLLSTILLNRTSRVQVDVVLHEFLTKWPSPESVVEAKWEDISSVIAPLGMRHRRAKGLIRFSRDYLNACTGSSSGKQRCATMTREEILSLFYCGDYAYDAYRIFVQRNISTLATDHALQDYVEYQRGAMNRNVFDSVTRSSKSI